MTDRKSDDSAALHTEPVQAEVLPAERPRLVGEHAGRVFDASGALDRTATRASHKSAGGGFEATANTGCSGPLMRWVGRLFGVFALVAVALAFLVAGGFTLAGAVAWAHQHPVVARAGVVAAVTFALPLLVPTGPVAIVPGYLWGSGQGLAVVLTGAVLGGMLNMFLARRIVGPRAEAFVTASPGLAALRRAIDARGFRIALALRMSPVTPYAVVSYLAGLTGISYVRYALASLLGGVPWTLVYATAGALLAESSRSVTLDADVGPAGPWLRIVGLVFTVVVAVWIGRAARRELVAATNAEKR